MWREYWRGSGAGRKVMWLSGNCKEFTYLGDRVCAGEGCQAAVTTITRCGWVMHRECGELLYGRGFALRQKGAVYNSYVRPAILYGSETWWLKVCDMGILQRTKRSMLIAVWSTTQGLKKIYRFDVHLGFEWNRKSVGYGKQCSLVRTCFEERGWSCLEKGVRYYGWRSREER